MCILPRPRLAGALAATILLIHLCAPSVADDEGLSLFVGTSHGGDAQLHPGLAPLTCSDCPDIARASMATDGAPPLVELGAGWVGDRGPIIGGGELFAIVTAGGNASGYAGMVTFAGFDVGRLFAVGGLGFGTYVGGAHASTFDALAGNARAELGIELARGWSVSTRFDLLKNNLSSTGLVTLGLAFAPRGWNPDGAR